MSIDEELIEKAIKDGHKIADKIRDAKTLDGIKELSSEVEEYSDFVNENFGILDDYDERDCEISAFLHVAYDWKQTVLQSENLNKLAAKKIYEEFMKQYLDFLNSKIWINGSYGIKLNGKTPS